MFGRSRKSGGGLLLAILATALAGGVAHSASRPPLDPADLTLRLVDLGPGFGVEDDGGCSGRAIGEGVPSSSSALPRFFARYRHSHRCSIVFAPQWSTPGAPAGASWVMSTAWVFGRPSGPVDWMRFNRRTAPYVGATLFVAPTLGDAALGYRIEGPEGRSDETEVGIMWRSGRVFAITGVTAPTAIAEGEAIRLATVQQARIATPTPLGAGENDDTEVALDDPSLGIDVHWLGRRLAPEGLPPLVLAYATGQLGRHEGPGYRVRLTYVTRRGRDAVVLGLWTPQAFRRASATRFGRLVWAERCARSQRIGVAGGHAIVYAGHARRPRRCAGARPDTFLAHVHLEGVVVTINAPECWSCRDPGGVYDSARGMRVLARAIRPR